MSNPTTCRICGPTCKDERTVTETLDDGSTVDHFREAMALLFFGPPGPTFTPVASPVTLDAPPVPDHPPTTTEGQRGVSGQLMQPGEKLCYDKNVTVTGYHVARAALEGMVRGLAEGRSGHSAHPVESGELAAAIEHVADMVGTWRSHDPWTSNEADGIARDYVHRGSARALTMVGTEERLRWHLEGQAEKSRGRQEAAKRARRGK